jgi:hypothetical protein
VNDWLDVMHRKMQGEVGLHWCPEWDNLPVSARFVGSATEWGPNPFRCRCGFSLLGGRDT